MGTRLTITPVRLTQQFTAMVFYAAICSGDDCSLLDCEHFARAKEGRRRTSDAAAARSGAAKAPRHAGQRLDAVPQSMVAQTRGKTAGSGRFPGQCRAPSERTHGSGAARGAW